MFSNPIIVVYARLEMTCETMAAMREPLLTMQAASRAEDVCHDYTFSVELAEPNVLRITERWENTAALEAHFAQPHMGVFQAAMAANPPVDRRATFYEVNQVPRPGT